MPSTKLAERILRFVQAKGYEPQRVQELAHAMGVGEDEHGDFHAACKALMKTGRVVLGSKSALMLPDPSGRIVGTYRGNPRGFGFVIPDEPNAHGDLFIPSGASGDAITGDTVAARVRKRGKRGGKMLFEGRITEVLKRGQSQFVGELRHQGGRWYVIPDGNTLHVPIRIADAGAKGAKSGAQVVVEILQYPAERVEARGVIVKVLGRRGEPGVDTLSIIEQHQLPGPFSEEVLEEARQRVAAYHPQREAKGREDLRQLTIITIDPDDAKDFDDAISLTKKAGGAIELGVHIADVAHFVREGSALDNEARERSNSIYLPGTVIPMLPPLLSNGICSLQERQTRLTKSAFITYDRRGRVTQSRVANTIIRSTKRLTYDQATRILAGKPGRTSAKVVALLKDMEALAHRIRERRLREGMLVLDLPDVELVRDENGRVIDVERADTSFTHTIIEMFMVEANEVVARLFAGKNVPHMRRMHAEPNASAGTSLRRFLRVLGQEVSDVSDRMVLQRLLDAVRGKPESFAVNLAVLRSMQQARYGPTLVGHYALASKHYSHFTSPIRRYPDLTIHRLIDQYVSGVFNKPKGIKQAPSEDALHKLGALCSDNERRAESAERELRLVLLLRMLEKHVGETFDGIVTGIANVGVFVQLERFLVDGLLRFDDLLDDWWEIDPSRGAVVGERTGHRITVGDRLEVTISRIQIPTRQLQLALATPLKKSKDKGKGRSSGRPKAHAGNRPAKKQGGVTAKKARSSKKRRSSKSRGRRR